MDLVHDRGSMDPVQSGGPWTPGLSSPSHQCGSTKYKCYQTPQAIKKQHKLPLFSLTCRLIHSSFPLHRILPNFCLFCSFASVKFNWSVTDLLQFVFPNSELDKACDALASSEKRSQSPRNTGLLSLDPVEDRTALYDKLLETYDWLEKVPYDL